MDSTFHPQYGWGKHFLGRSVWPPTLWWSQWGNVEYDSNGNGYLTHSTVIYSAPQIILGVVLGLSLFFVIIVVLIIVARRRSAIGTQDRASCQEIPNRPPRPLCLLPLFPSSLPCSRGQADR